jgi:NADPH-dependent ferric siderophore reductase
MMPQMVRVRGVRRITPRMVRVTLGDADLACPTADSCVKLFFPLPGKEEPELVAPVAGDVVTWYREYLATPDDIRPPMRTYTVRSNRPDRREFDVDFVLHRPGGPASSWAEAAEPGNRVAFLGPTGVHPIPPGAGWLLLIGDETAVPAIGSIIESTPPGTAVRAFAEVAGPEEHQRFSPAASLDLRWVHGGGLLDAVRRAEFDGRDGFAWVAGEAGLVRSLRRHLVGERGFAKSAVAFHGYWRKGMSEEDVGREGLRRIAAGLDPVPDPD